VLWDQLRVNGVCELDDGTQLTGAELRRLACEADIIPIVLSGDGVPLDVGRTFRLATYWQRLALRALHATCAVEGCDVPFDQCEVHHLRPWEKGGRTDLDNLVPLCSYHHTWVHDLDGNVVLELLPDRTLRLPGFPVRPCAARRRRLVDRLKAPPDLVGTR
ncbi:MAG TPA: HNH endonuclease, partial [Acidimicrobiales bacterium]|nr:HNH endonuclease [Acidimicrobiales bacterium]